MREKFAPFGEKGSLERIVDLRNTGTLKSEPGAVAVANIDRDILHIETVTLPAEFEVSIVA